MNLLDKCCKYGPPLNLVFVIRSQYVAGYKCLLDLEKFVGHTFNIVSVHPSCAHIEYKVVIKEKHLNATVKGGFEIHIKLQVNFYAY